MEIKMNITITVNAENGECDCAVTSGNDNDCGVAQPRFSTIRESAEAASHINKQPITNTKNSSSGCGCGKNCCR